MLIWINYESCVFFHGLVLPDAIETLHDLSKDQMDVPHLWDMLSSMDGHLKKDEFLDVVKLATVDGGYYKY